MKKVWVMLVAFASSLMAFSQGKDVMDIASGSADHTTLVAALKAADLSAILKGSGPFTLLAPTNVAFQKLPAGMLSNLLKLENKAQLAKILRYHVISGNLDETAIRTLIRTGNGKAVLTTLGGGKLTSAIDHGKLSLTDELGNTAHFTATDLKGTNGVIHVIDRVVLPGK
jgi:uncharacterized surface protein with fasciclin (FAS1) repeats